MVSTVVCYQSASAVRKYATNLLIMLLCTMLEYLDVNDDLVTLSPFKDEVPFPTDGDGHECGYAGKIVLGI